MIKKYTLNSVLMKLRKRIGNDAFEFLSHSKNYVTADLFSKALGFISIPVFTRLLTPEEYGVVSIYSTIVSVLSILIMLNIYYGISRYYYEDKQDYAEFLGTNITFIIGFHAVIITILFLFKERLANFFNIDTQVFLFACFTSVLAGYIDVYLRHLNYTKKSNEYSRFSVIQYSAVLVFSIILTLILVNEKYLGRIYGQFFITVLFFIIASFKLVKLSKKHFQIEHIKYSLKLSIPLLPHALSGFILAAFDRVIIQQVQGAASTGLYSFAYNVGMIMNVFVMGMNRSWVPIFYEKLNSKEYQTINSLSFKYVKYTNFIAIGFILFSKEIVLILADKRYYSALSIVPVIILSYVFLFLYTLYANYSFYSKRTGLISLNTFIAGAVNIILNYMFVPRFGYSVAAYTTLISYILLFILHFINIKYVLKEKQIIPLLSTLKYMHYIFVSIAIFYILEYTHINYILNLFIKLCYIIFITKVFFLTNRSVSNEKSN